MYPILTIAPNAIHFPSRTAERRTGFETSVCMTPELISPDSVSTGSSTASSSVRKFAA